MRQFSAVLESPRSCACCGSALGASDLGISRGKFRLEFTEGATFTLGAGIQVTSDGGKLVVRLRHKRGSGRGWGVRRNYNSAAFARGKHEWQADEKDPSYGWYHFTFDLPEFKPTYSTWWAELIFVEIEPFKQGFNGGPVEAHSAATLRLKLETLE